MLKRKHLIAGEWVGSDQSFYNEVVWGDADSFAAGTVELVDRACRAARDAFPLFAHASRFDRAKFLRRIAEEIDARGAEITEVGQRETGLPAARLDGERHRTMMQLRLFADHIEAGDYLDRRKDEALPDRTPLPRPELRLIQRPVGPVAVFGASNFPLAFSTAGGDTASALAAGCPVVVKGHSAHPGVSDIVAQAIDAARRACDLPAGVFNQVQGGDRSVGQALVQHEDIKAVGFTGSLGGGRALFDLCAARPDPIPFFGELGSVNPVFVLDQAMAARGATIAEDWAGSLTMGAGQFCTNPGIVVLQEGDAADIFIAAAAAALAAVDAQVMLTGGIGAAFETGRGKLVEKPAVQAVVDAPCSDRKASPVLLKVSAKEFLADSELREEVFGPLGVIVAAADAAERMQVAQAFRGQLTATVQMEDGDAEEAAELVSVLEHKAGRILFNGFPTGVEVCDSMVHGGPYPASTNFGATSVGTLSIRRWLRPVCYQNAPKALAEASMSMAAE